jgi:hypothetical protein
MIKKPGLNYTANEGFISSGSIVIRRSLRSPVGPLVLLNNAPTLDNALNSTDSKDVKIAFA